ncbi:MAG: hypothetical protein JWO31_4012 [Phycisphaerales bacterium]|nr:hypothetical protein [Phycisphaerales bacterium]
MLIDGPITPAPPPAAADPLPDTRPYTLAAAFLRSHEYARVVARVGPNGHDVFAVAAATGLRHWREEFYRFEACVYRRMVTEELVADVTTFLNDQTAFGGRDQRVAALRVTRALVGDVVAQLRALCQVRTESMPLWLTDAPRPDAEDVIAFRNGLLSIEGWIADRDHPLLKPTHEWFSEIVMPYDWTAGARCDRWLAFLRESLVDAQLVDVLQEFFGYCLTNSTRHQKLLWMHGVSGAGKSTVANVLKNVVGARNTTNFELWDLLGQFTLSSFVGKRVAIAADAAIGQGHDAEKILAKIKGISGEDGQLVDRKNREMLSTVLSVRLVISTNEFPNLPDTADALARRTLFLPFNRSFVGVHDPGLGDALADETPGITAWALAGLVRLLGRGRFADAAASAETQNEFKRLQSAVYAFVQDCCGHEDYDEKRRTGQTGTADLFRAYKAWCKQNEKHPMSRDRFCSRMRAAAPYAHRARLGTGTDREYAYRNIVLKPEWVHVPDLP